MFALFASDPVLRSRARAMLPADPPPVATGSWSRFERLLTGSACSCAVVEWLSDPWISRLGRSGADPGPAGLPRLLVTRHGADNARRLKDVAAAEVVWLEALDEELPEAARRLAERALRADSGRILQGLPHLHPSLRWALHHALTAPRPVLSVSGLARSVGWDRRTLARHWRQGAEDGLRLTELVQWILLLRAVERKRVGVAWRQVAGGLGVRERTLFRVSRRLTGSTLQEVAGAGVPRLRAWIGALLRQSLGTSPGSGAPETSGPSPGQIVRGARGRRRRTMEEPRPRSTS